MGFYGYQLSALSNKVCRNYLESNAGIDHEAVNAEPKFDPIGGTEAFSVNQQLQLYYQNKNIVAFR